MKVKLIIRIFCIEDIWRLAMVVFCGLALLMIKIITSLNNYPVERITIDPVITLKRIGVYCACIDDLLL